MPPLLPARTRARQFLIALSLTCITVILAFGGLEWFLGVRQTTIVGPRAYTGQVLRDRFVAWFNNPGFANDCYKHNAQGFRRLQDVSIDKPARQVRIFLLGGSAAYGFGGAYREVDDRFVKIHNNQTLDYYLEEKLNATFSGVRWEVINSAAVAFRLYQQLPLIQSRLLRYRPDYLILMDGYNDLGQLAVAGDHYDPYATTTYMKDEFDELANPTSFSSLLSTTRMLLLRNSALYRAINSHFSKRQQHAERQQTLNSTPEFGPVTMSDLTVAEQAQFVRSRSQIGYYAHTARQINRILTLDSVTPLFLLQPVLLLSQKPFTESEKRLYQWNRRLRRKGGVYNDEQLYPLMAEDMRRASSQDGFRFEDLTGTFDETREQAFTDYCHLTPAGNRMLADRIMAIMLESFQKSAQAVLAGNAGAVPRGTSAADHAGL